MHNIISSCKYLLNNYPEAETCKNYLDKRLSQNSQDLFEFGYYPPINEIKSLTSLTGEDLLKNLKLLYFYNITDSLCHRSIPISYFENYSLIMPFKNVRGKSIAIVARCLLSEEDRKIKKIAKYKNTVFKKSHHVFGLFENKQSIIDQNYTYVVEGQFDVIKAKEKGLNNVVALGCSDMSAYQFSLITRYTNNIFLLLDNDEAGEKGRKKIFDKFNKFANIKNSYVPYPYKDIDECLSENNLNDICLT